MDFARDEAWVAELRSECKDKNVSAAVTGRHCDTASSTSLANTASATEAACEADCCRNPHCSCWTLTSWERADGGSCRHGRPCCW